ncbi:MAG TPA: 3-deoxy-manno-octulosonate cytidylyltransferase [Hyphomicrobiaceae bacterium]|nr:3-deoxy-manno-octulosonate cytidylyltransferase [Hyphomicrobiaceae bacterium]
MPRTLIVIPARMHSTRLPRKPLAEIGGQPMIAHVWKRAMAADAGRVVVATDDEDILAAVRKAGGEALMTRADHVSGSDRVFEAVTKVDPRGEIEIVLNLQGDLPAMDASLVHQCLAPLAEAGANPGPDIATIAAEIVHEADRTNPNSVKVVGTTTHVPRRLRALYFTRATAPWGDGPLYHHFGMYAYRRAALERFVSLAPSPLEIREKLEQLRALEDGMRIDVTLVDSIPVEVNTPEDLDLARRVIAG